MSTAVESFRIPIDTTNEQSKGDATSDLQSRVLQIINQKGHFRHVRERSVLAEEEPDDDEDGDGAENENDIEETSEKRDEKLAKSRDDMLQQLSRAQNDTLVALELVSFLLSKNSVSAQSTMSEELKRRVPTGTLETRVVEQRKIPDVTTNHLTLHSQGWRSEGFSKVSQAFSSASGRLRKESERESTYWEQVASLKERQMAVSRYPRDNSAMAVHYSSVNAAPQYQQRGIALLRQDADSGVYLDRGASSTDRGRMQVEIFRGSRRTGHYKFDPALLVEKSDIAQSITAARDELLEEELFHEIDREARITANQGVTTREQTISFAVGDEYEVSVSSKPPRSQLDAEVEEDNPLAGYIGLSLKALLQQAHHDSSVRRTRTPPPMLPKLPSIPEYAVLRPLMSHLRHHAAAEELRARVDQSILQPLRRASLDVDWRVGSPEIGEPHNSDGAVYGFASNKASRSRYNLTLPSEKQVAVTITSHLGSPVYGTQYEVSGLDHQFALVGAAVYRSVEAVSNALLEMMTLDLMACAMSVMKSPETSDARWSVSRPHKGELVLSSRKSRKMTAGMRIELVNGSLILRLAPATPEYQKGKKVLAWIWSEHESSPRVSGEPTDVGISKDGAGKLSFSEVAEQSLNLAG